MSAHKSLADEAHLRTVRRFLEGKLDRLPNDWELAEWLRFCYHREAYAEAVQLFQHIHPEHVEPERYAELKKIVAVCRMRAAAREGISIEISHGTSDEVGKSISVPEADRGMRPQIAAIKKGPEGPEGVIAFHLQITDWLDHGPSCCPVNKGFRLSQNVRYFVLAS